MRKGFLIVGLIGLTFIVGGCSLLNKASNDIEKESPQRLQQPVKKVDGGPVTSQVSVINPQNENMVFAEIQTSMGNISLKLFKEDAPKTVENFTRLAKEGFYDGVKFHRVINGFMIQAGDPLTKDDSLKAQWGTGGPGYTFEDEINDNKNVRGVISMANTGRPGTNGSQFFIVTGDAFPSLDPKHTVFGEVTKGMEVVDRISAVEVEAPGMLDRPREDVVITGIVITE